RRLVCPGLVLADSDGGAALAAPKSRVAHEARYPADEVLDFLIPLFELLEQLRGALAGIAANDCVHHCLLGTRRGDRDPIERPAETRSEAIRENRGGVRSPVRAARAGTSGLPRSAARSASLRSRTPPMRASHARSGRDPSRRREQASEP